MLGERTRRRRRPIMSAWADYVTEADASNVVPLHVHVLA
jgi:hypothetical protein